MSNESTFKDGIPQGACTLTVGEFALGDNGDGSKSAPVSLVARSGKPIEHWFWGRVVHDLAGMQLHKSRLPIDYVHDSKEIVGYLNHFDIGTGDLVTSGALTPFKDSDRATEIIFKSKAGVPYEASINFGGDGIKVQEVGPGEVTQVNGAEFEGPGVVIREWPLRGVAVCPYGADMNTDSSLLSAGKKYTAAAYVAPSTTTEESNMSNVDTSVDVAAEATEPEAAVETTDQPVESELTEATEEEAVEVEAVEGEEEATEEDAANAPEPEDEEPAELSREEFSRIKAAFGADIAASTFETGGTYESALQLAHDAQAARITELEAQVGEMSATSNGKPAKVTAASAPKSSLFNSTK